MKTVDEIYQELRAAFTARCGRTADDDCDLSVRLYAAAAQIQALLIQADWVLNQSFPQTAAGTYLDRHAAMRGLTRAPAAPAAGTLRFSLPAAASADLTVEAGTVCMTAGRAAYRTTAAAVLPAGSLWADAPAEAVEAGAAGNAGAGAVTVLTAAPPGITAVTNPAAFTGGADEEGDEALRARILESYQRLPNGANAAWYEATALSHSGVAAARAVGRARGAGTVDVYVAAPAGLPDAALLAEVQADLSEKREIAVDVLVKAPAPLAVDVSAQIAVEDGADFSAVKAAAESAAAGLFTGRLLGRAVQTADLVALLRGVDGVANCHLLSPAADTAADSGVLPLLGALTVAELGV